MAGASLDQEFLGKGAYRREKKPKSACEGEEEAVYCVCLPSDVLHWGVQTWMQAASCRSWGLSSVWSADLSIPAGVKRSPHTWKPFSCSCSSWRRRVCMLLMIRLWCPSSSTPTCLTSLPRGEKHKQKTLLYIDLLWLKKYQHCSL